MTATVLAEGQHQRVTAARMNMAFGQKGHARRQPWGVAPGYGDRRPSAKQILGLRAVTRVRVIFYRFARIRMAVKDDNGERIINLPCREKHEHTDACHLSSFHDPRRAFATLRRGCNRADTTERVPPDWCTGPRSPTRHPARHRLVSRSCFRPSGTASRTESHVPPPLSVWDESL